MGNLPRGVPSHQGPSAMSMINFRKRELNIKIVYVGPALGGKTSSIAALCDAIPAEKRTELTSIATEGDRTLFFDFFGTDEGKIGNLDIRIMVYGVPGQTWYRSTRKSLLNGADGLVFVADSTAERRQDNMESLDDVKTMLAEYGYDYSNMPLVIQFNKRDLPDLMAVDQMETDLNERGVPVFPTVANQRVGTREAFEAVFHKVVDDLRGKLSSEYGII